MSVPKTVLVTGANGYIGAAVARAFSRAGWETYGLVRASASIPRLRADGIAPVLGSIDDLSSHASIVSSVPPTLDTIVSTTENIQDYLPHYTNTVVLLTALAENAVKSECPKPLVIFTSGCKDYGPGPHYAHDPELQLHTEDSPLNPPSVIAPRTKHSLDILNNYPGAGARPFDAALVRPTNVVGHSSSYYGAFFLVAAEAAARGEPIRVPAGVRKDSILHALHVDDCAEAYVAIASHGRRSEDVAGQVFNISAREYETLEKILNALVDDFGIEKGVEWRGDGVGKSGSQNSRWPAFLIDFPQWTGSDKLRGLTGWTDVRPLFSQAIGQYRAEAKAAAEDEIEGRRVRELEERTNGFARVMAAQEDGQGTGEAGTA